MTNVGSLMVSYFMTVINCNYTVWIVFLPPWNEDYRKKQFVKNNKRGLFYVKTEFSNHHPYGESLMTTYLSQDWYVDSAIGVVMRVIISFARSALTCPPAFLPGIFFPYRTMRPAASSRSLRSVA